MTDETDCCAAAETSGTTSSALYQVAFDAKTGQERQPWDLKCLGKVSRAFVLFVAQMTLISIVVIFCLIQLAKNTAETSKLVESSSPLTYICILSLCLGYVLLSGVSPPPTQQQTAEQPVITTTAIEEENDE